MGFPTLGLSKNMSGKSDRRLRDVERISGRRARFGRP